MSRTNHRSEHRIRKGRGREACRATASIATMRDVNGRNRENREALEQVAASQRLPLDGLELDVTDERSVQSVVSAAVDRYDGFDAVINNAGFAGIGVTEAS